MKNRIKRKRFRDYGFNPGILPPGPRNMISDVPGVQVGHLTKAQGSDIRTGITLIDPGTRELFKNKLPAAIAVGNGFGKLAGLSQVEELGTLEAPIALTNTLAVGRVIRGVVDLVLKNNPSLDAMDSINAVVGETNDGFLNNFHRNVLIERDVAVAYRRRSRTFAQGNVGAGTGTRAFAWKGGIGSASRRIALNRRRFNLGALVQTNYGGELNILGVPVGRLLGETDFDSFASPVGDGSCLIVLATDAPVSARQLKRIARRSFLALARTGSVIAHSSGDYAIAFSTSRAGLEGSDAGTCLADAELNRFFLAAVEAVEESVYESLFAAKDMRGRGGHRLQAIPVTRVVEILRAHRR